MGFVVGPGVASPQWGRGARVRVRTITILCHPYMVKTANFIGYRVSG